MSLEGKVVLITGAGGGIGCATAVRFAKEGAKLVLVDLSDDSISKTITEVKALTEDYHFVAANVTKSADVKNLVDEAVNKYGRIDVFFNNAGIDAQVAPIDEYEEDMFDRILSVNTKGVFLSLKYVLKVMKKQQSGSIINTSSIHGTRGIIDRSAYVASKHAVVGLTRTASAETASLKIRVNAICPATIITELTKRVAKELNPDNPQEHFDKMLEKVPAKRFGTPEEVANLVKFLASEESEFITGAIIPIDGGTTATF